VSPIDDASLLIDGDVSKTFKIVRRSRRKESEGENRGGRRKELVFQVLRATHRDRGTMKRQKVS